MKILPFLADVSLNVPAANSLPHVDINITNILSWVFGGAAIVAVVFIVKGGFNYTTSNGDPQKAQKALRTLIYAIVGLLIAAFAEVIVAFVSSNAGEAAASIIQIGELLC